jgi:hypothetical protein
MNMKFLLSSPQRLFRFTKLHRTASAVSTLATVVFLLALGTAMSGAPKWSTQDPASSSSAQPQPASTTQRTKQLIGSEAITIMRYGFQPKEISRAPGRFFLQVENRSGVNPLVLRVSAQGGSTLKEFTVTSDQLDWADEVNLPEGQYTVTEVNHGWTCRLTITTAP